MSDTVQVLLQYGYLVLFAFVLAEQVGPADPRGSFKAACPSGGRRR